MAYKFQLGDARLSGSLIQEGSIQTSGEITPLIQHQTKLKLLKL